MEFVQVVSVENMRKSDARTIAEHTPSAELMYRAAQGIFCLLYTSDAADD